MNLLISFSARQGGNCDDIARYLAGPADRVIPMREIDARPCAGCACECVSGPCKYRADGIYDLLTRCAAAARTVFVVPMYCGAPAALYSILSERSQDFFVHARAAFEAWTRRLYIVGVYGGADRWPHFLSQLAGQFGVADPHRVLGLERGRYRHKMDDRLLREPEVREMLDRFRDFAFHGGENRV